MRFSHLQLFNQGLQSFSRLQSDNLRTQEQISTGKKILTPSDDPVASTRIQQLQDELALNEQYQKNIQAIELQLNAQEVQISSAENSLIRLRELAVQAGNGALNAQDRRAIAAEVQVIQDEMLAVANARDGSGKYIFAGYQTGDAPYEKFADGTIHYVGDQGQRSLKVSATTSMSMTTRARDVFTDVPSVGNSFAVRADQNNQADPPAIIKNEGFFDQDVFNANFETYPQDYVVTFDDPPTTYSIARGSDGFIAPVNAGLPYNSGASIEVLGRQFSITGSPEAGDRFVIESRKTESVFETTEKLLEGLQEFGDSGSDSIDLSALVGRTLDSYDNSLDKMIQARTSIGARLNVAENTRNIHEDVELINQKILSDVRDVDYEEAISQLSYQTFVLEAAQQSFARIANLSLFNFLR